jgi:endonuclease/exonuclease/phosphatase family metal-dependent hydrolase
MKITTLNIDWARKYKSATHINKIESYLVEHDFDILIITEGVDLKLPNYPFQYKTKGLPQNEEYEGLNYSVFLNETIGNRVIIYSKYESTESFNVSDDYTSICKHFNTPFGEITIYATIIGTWFKKLPYAKQELDNCISDCNRIFMQTDTLCLAGDLNTSFLEDEQSFQINSETTNQLKKLCTDCQLNPTTIQIKENIDHIFLPKRLAKNLKITSEIFIKKNELSDHKGIVVEISI